MKDNKKHRVMNEKVYFTPHKVVTNDFNVAEFYLRNSSKQRNTIFSLWRNLIDCNLSLPELK